MFVSRRNAGPDPWLGWKVGLFSAGAGLGLAGMYLESGWLIGAAVAVLFGGVLLRFLPAGEEASAELGQEEG